MTVTVAALALAACQAPPKTSSAPEAERVVVPEPWAFACLGDLAKSPLDTSGHIEVLYASDRLHIGTPAAKRATGNRSLQMRYGTAAVKIEKLRGGHKGWPADVAQFVSATPDENGADGFARRLRDEATAGRRDVLLFVHGYNNGFDYAAAATAVLGYYAGPSFVPVCFSWPSEAKWYAYLTDREAADFGVSHLRRLIPTIAGVEGVRSIHIVTHSTGALVVSTTLRELALQHRGDARKALKLGHLVCAAPDVDRDWFRLRFIGEEAHLLPRHTTVYTSSEDGVLSVAQFMRSGDSTSPAKTARYPRLGMLALNRIDLPGCCFDVIDTHTLQKNGDVVDTFFTNLGHSYLFKDPRVSSDILMLLRHDQTARHGERGRRLKHAGGNEWTIPLDYFKP